MNNNNIMAANHSIVTRSQARPPSTQTEGTMQTSGMRPRGGVQRRAPVQRVHPLNCNKCCQPLTTTVWVCACNCSFCDPCATSHFSSSHNCPVCNVRLENHHLAQIVVADPPQEGKTPQDTQQMIREGNFQGYFKKTNANFKSMTFNDLGHRVLRQYQDCRDGIGYLLKQATREMSLLKHQLVKHKQAVSSFKQQITSLQQKLNNQKLQSDQQLNNQRLQYEKSIGDMKRQLEEKENLIVTFRQRYGGGNNSVGSRSSGENRRHNAPEASQRMGGQQQQQRKQNESTHTHPPMKRYLHNQEVKEREKQQAMRQGSRPLMGTVMNSNGKRPHPDGYGGGGGGDLSYVSSSRSYPQQHLQQQQQQQPAQVGPKGPRGASVGIRTNLTQHEFFPFTSSGENQMNKRRRRAPPAGLIPGQYSQHSTTGQPQRRHHQGSNVSPSQAFGDQPHGGYNSSRSSSQFQQQQHGRRGM